MKTKGLGTYIILLISLTAPAWALDPKLEKDISTALGMQPPNELAAQRLLPQVRDEMWTKLAKCAVNFDDKNGIYSIKLTPEVKALNGKTVTVRGFVLPMDGSDHTKHFLITRNTPVCMYCPPGEPNEVIEVTAERAIPWSNKMMSVTGRLSLVNDKEQALFFRIEKAEAKQ